MGWGPKGGLLQRALVCGGRAHGAAAGQGRGLNPAAAAAAAPLLPTWMPCHANWPSGATKLMVPAQVPARLGFTLNL